MSGRVNGVLKLHEERGVRAGAGDHHPVDLDGFRIVAEYTWPEVALHQVKW